MPYEVSISGGSPWGFRLAGGPFIGKPTTIARVTPGGKAGQANVMQGDHLVAVNGFSVSHMDLPELLEMIKISGWTLNLTLMSPEEEEETKKKRHSEANITSMSDIERPRSQMMMTPVSERSPSRQSSQLSKGSPKSFDSNCTDLCNQNNENNCNFESKVSSIGVVQGDFAKDSSQSARMPKLVIKVGGKPKNTQHVLQSRTSKRATDCDKRRPNTPVSQEENGLLGYEGNNTLQVPPAPKPRNRKPAPGVENLKPESEKKAPKQVEIKQIEDQLDQEKQKKLPDYIKRQLKPPKPLPTEFNSQVSWLHDKLKIKTKGGNGLKDPGNSLKVAAAAYPCQRIEIEGPLSATIVHAQYNTPVGMYSANQIVNTLVHTAAAKGAEVPDPEAFEEQNIEVDKSSSVYKLVHKKERSSPLPAQSRSIHILDAFLDRGKELPHHLM
ncbi:uncharacterized protein LOC143471837 isoform X2 [Clavelina lepadiformis]|uniref:uncharacterized protein LOC143471837 isoform X2 n=1 Tax=Clavelina lepadiformis TaxID=159417 RepID=UPI004042F5BE